MKNNGRSLEEQRSALLEQIHASRTVYRRMLTQGESIETASAHEHAAAGTDIREEDAANSTVKAAHTRRTIRTQEYDVEFPRSTTMRWVMTHPFYTAAALVGIAMLIPKASRMGKKAGSRLSSRRHGKSVPPPGGPLASGQAHTYGPPPQNGYPQTVYIQQPASPKTGALAGVAAFGGTALTSIITIATMVLRDPAKMQMAMKAFSSASAYLHKRRGEKMPQGTRTQGVSSIKEEM
jgi:hypothetical protein